MKIELKCKCGSSAYFEDEKLTYVDGCGFLNISDGKEGEHRPLVIEMLAKDWISRHQGCLGEVIENE